MTFPDLIEKQSDLDGFIASCANEPFVTIDTEFVREKTYYSKLCVIQLATQADAVAVDALAPGLSLEPIWGLLRDPDIAKVIHAGRQDVEIFFEAMGDMPKNLFDTQIAAMVCGFGEQAGYDTLVRALAGKKIDKSHRYTNWAARPLTKQQLTYALADVTHLRVVYRELKTQLDKKNRSGWIEEDLAELVDPATYTVEPEETWRRLKPRTDKPIYLSVLREVASWREKEAQTRDMPRNRVLRDDAISEIAAVVPKSGEALGKIRTLSDGFSRSKSGRGLLAAIEAGVERAEVDPPSLPARPKESGNVGPTLELLRVLLKHKAEAHQLAPKLIATAKELEKVAHGARDVALFRDWRYEVMGADAEAMIDGRCWLGLKNGAVELFREKPV